MSDVRQGQDHTAFRSEKGVWGEETRWGILHQGFCGQLAWVEGSPRRRVGGDKWGARGELRFQALVCASSKTASRASVEDRV